VFEVNLRSAINIVEYAPSRLMTWAPLDTVMSFRTKLSDAGMDLPIRPSAEVDSPAPVLFRVVADCYGRVGDDQSDIDPDDAGALAELLYLVSQVLAIDPSEASLRLAERPVVLLDRVSAIDAARFLSRCRKLENTTPTLRTFCSITESIRTTSLT
jgi:hypothetical protein